MKKKLRRGLFGVLLVVFAAGIGMMLHQLSQYASADRTYDRAQQIAFRPPVQETTVSTPSEPEATDPQPEVPAVTEPPVDAGVLFLREVNVVALQQVNPDVLGWIYIPDTVISYPLMQTHDRDEYLHKAWDGSANSSGSIFLEQKNSRELTDFNTIIYGHHLTNGTMFSSILQYKNQAYFDSHPYIYVTNGKTILRYQVFAAYEAPVQSDTYRLYFADSAARQAAIEHYLQSSSLQRTCEPGTEDRILTLSTCTGTGIYTTRWVVQAVLTGQWKK